MIDSLICAGASRAEMRLASAAIARAADAWCRARALPPRRTRLELEEVALPDVALPGLVHRPCEQ